MYHLIGISCRPGTSEDQQRSALTCGKHGSKCTESWRLRLSSNQAPWHSRLLLWSGTSCRHTRSFPSGTYCLICAGSRPCYLNLTKRPVLFSEPYCSARGCLGAPDFVLPKHSAFGNCFLIFRAGKYACEKSPQQNITSLLFSAQSPIQILLPRVSEYSSRRLSGLDVTTE